MLSGLRVPRWNDVLLEIHKSQERYRYCEKLFRRIDGSKTQIREIVKQLERSNLITINHLSKIKKLNLTEKGRKIALSIMTIKLELQ
jgi:predicted transcriptional regulator